MRISKNTKKSMLKDVANMNFITAVVSLYMGLIILVGIILYLYMMTKN